MIKIIKVLFNLFRKPNTREEIVLEKCGCWCKCPSCMNILNDTSECEKLNDEGLYEYTCVECSFKSKFHFGIAPLPLYMG
jgi:hypothetical protein